MLFVSVGVVVWCLLFIDCNYDVLLCVVVSLLVVVVNMCCHCLVLCGCCCLLLSVRRVLRLLFAVAGCS